MIDFGIRYRDFRRGELAVDALHASMLQHFETLRRDPGDNILSALVAAPDESGGLSDDELSSMAMLLLEAGFETTVNLIGNGVALLTRHRDQLDVLRETPARWPGAVDEVLRFDSPVQDAVLRPAGQGVARTPCCTITLATSDGGTERRPRSPGFR